MALAAELAADHGATITAVVVIEVPAAAAARRHMLDEEAAARRVLEEARAIAERAECAYVTAGARADARRGDRRGGARPPTPTSSC